MQGNSTEIWRPVLGSDIYEISSSGRIRSKARITYRVIRGKSRIYKSRERFLTPVPVRGSNGRSDPYYLVCLRGYRKGGNFYVHALVLEAFRGPRPEGMQACHNDGNRLNNRLDNLRWDTPESNMQDRYRHGTNPAGERNPNAKITESIVRKIRKLYSTNKYTKQELAYKYNVTIRIVENVITYKTWKHVA